MNVFIITNSFPTFFDLHSIHKSSFPFLQPE